MTDKEFNKFDKHYNELIKKGTIKTMNDAYIYKLAIEQAIEVISCCVNEPIKMPKLTTDEFNSIKKSLSKGNEQLVCYKRCGKTLPSNSFDNICLNCGSSIIKN